MPVLAAVPLPATSTPSTRDEWVACHPFRAHVRHLLAPGTVDADVLALVAGVPVSTVRRLALTAPRFGERMRHVDAERLLAVSLGDLARLADERADAALPRLWLLHLRRRGWTSEDVAAAAGLSTGTVEALLGSRLATVTRLQWLRIEAVKLRAEVSTPPTPRVAAHGQHRAA